MGASAFTNDYGVLRLLRQAELFLYGPKTIRKFQNATKVLVLLYASDVKLGGAPEWMMRSIERSMQSLGQGESGERREDCRYAATAALEYRVFTPARSRSATGRLIDISSGGILFVPAAPLEWGVEIELTIGWPARRQYPPAMDLWIAGRVIRTDPKGVAVKILRYDFRPRTVVAAILRDKSLRG